MKTTEKYDIINDEMFKHIDIENPLGCADTIYLRDSALNRVMYCSLYACEEEGITEAEIRSRVRDIINLPVFKHLCK